jgi:hypothetical protein
MIPSHFVNFVIPLYRKMNLSELDTIKTGIIIGHHAKALELPLTN